MTFKSLNRLTMMLGILATGCWVLFFYFSYSMNIYILEFNLGSMWSMNLSLSIIFDWISLSFSSVVLVISLSVFWFASLYMKEDLFFYRFIWLLFSFVLSMLILIFSGSFFSILIGWDGLGVTSFLLIIYYQSNESLKSGYLTLLINRIGDILIIISLYYLVYNSSLNFFLYKPESKFYTMFLVLICFAALTKSAQYPFSSWLPAAMAAPTPVSALVHSSTLVTAGIYLVIRLSENINLDSWILSMFLFVGSLTTLLGSLSALNEFDLKKIIALSTLSQLGIMVFCLGLNNVYLSLFHLYTHAMFKALLFMVAGWILMMSYGVQDMRMLGNILYHQPLMKSILFTSILALMGVPFLSAYYSKHLVIEMMFNGIVNIFSYFVLILSSMITCIYSLRMMKILSFSKFNISIINMSDIKLLNKLPYFILSLMSIFSGKMFNNLIINFNTRFFLINFNSWFLFLVLLIGVFLGLIFKYANNILLSTMFFLVPFSFFFKVFFFKFSKKLKFLDYGLLEPQNILLNSFFNLSSKTVNMIIWPIMTNFIWFRFMIIILMVFFYLWLMY
uniref:NADH-ubiquinone oxidoreductase chain 5 n=1 Tax=Omalonyx unguis TaxID=1851496 RepID=A0A8F7CB68_9EUPU|nr:NADH dehydrogenase subunit 5 [Omalonyx unguis]